MTEKEKRLNKLLKQAYAYLMYHRRLTYKKHGLLIEIKKELARTDK